MSATEFKIEELGNKTYSYKDLGCSDWPLETVMPKVYTAIISAARALLVSAVVREKNRFVSLFLSALLLGSL